MTSPRVRLTYSVLAVLRAFNDHPGRRLYGFEVLKLTNLNSGTVYPVLRRLTDTGWLEEELEHGSPRQLERPLRRYYRLTTLGQRAAENALSRAQAAIPIRGLSPLEVWVCDATVYLRTGQDAGTFASFELTFQQALVLLDALATDRSCAQGIGVNLPLGDEVYFRAAYSTPGNFLVWVARSSQVVRHRLWLTAADFAAFVIESPTLARRLREHQSRPAQASSAE